MAIRQLSLTHFRNLDQVTLEFDSRINLICGGNGSGKTSLLEAIYVLCQARSFRTHQLKQCIQHQQAEFVLFGRFDGYQAGLSRDRQKLSIHVDGEAVKRRSELIRKSPVSIVNADSFGLIAGSPQQRRRFIDWCLFHVEPDYADYWVAFQHALKQRNRLLKTRRDLHLLDYWDVHLLKPSLEINRIRRRCMLELSQLMDEELGDILDGLSIGIEYQPGWPTERSLEETLKHDRERDRHAGFTHSGIHRDELRFSQAGRPVTEVLSRGQGKRLCLALVVAALNLVGRHSERKIILLIDDLHSELDNEAQTLVYRQLDRLDLQLLISNVDQRVSPPLRDKVFKMFHVEHGTINARNLS